MAVETVIFMYVLYIQILANTIISVAGTKSSMDVRNVLMFIIDDMRPEIGVYASEDESLYPSIKTPNIDALAGESIRFKNAYSQVTVCAPSRASFLTGRRPDTTQVFSNAAPYWRDNGGNYTTIPQYFKEQGFTTYASGKIFHTGYDDDNDYSWTEPNYRPFPNILYWYANTTSWEIVDPDSSNVSLPDTAIKADAIERLNQASSEPENPFFIAVGFQKPHLPFVCPQEFYDLYPEEDIYLPSNPYSPVDLPVIAWSNWSDFQVWSDTNQYDSSFNNTMPEFETISLRKAYYACVSYMDSLVGDVLQELASLGLSDNTAIILTSDHGFHLGEHADWGKQTNFELDTRVPLMMKIPGITDARGMVTESLVELVDLFPTLIDLMGLDPIEQCPDESFDIELCHEGYSMMSLVSDTEPDQWKSATFSQYYRYIDQAVPSMGYSIHVSEYHYVKWVGYFNNTADWDTVVAEELFDLAIDPRETVNVAGYEEYITAQEEMESKLVAGWREALPQE